MTDKTYDAGAERAVIGSILLDNSTLDEAATLIDAQSFYVKAHRLIWAAALDLQRRGQAVDVVTLGSHLKDKGRIEDVGGAIGLTKFSDSATSTNVMGYATIIRDKAATRHMIQTARAIVEQGTNGVVDVQEYLSESQTMMTRAATLDGRDEPRMLGDKLTTDFDDWFSGKPPRGMVQTGIAAIDNMTGGFPTRLLTVVGGRPGMGKSTLLLNVAVNAALAGKRVLYVTMEDAVENQQKRALARFSDINLERFMMNRLRGDESSTVIEAANKLSNIPLWLIDSSMDTRRLGRVATKQLATHGLDLLIADHLGYFTDKGKEYEAYSAASKSCAILAKVIDAPVALAVQLNRGLEDRSLAARRPVLSDMRGSGQIEEHARVVWFVYRDHAYNPTTADPHDMELIVAKKTHGPVGTIPLWCKLSRMYIRDKGAENGY